MTSTMVFSDNLARIGLGKDTKVFWNYTEALLYEEAIKRNEGKLTRDGAFATFTGEHTGRAAKDKYIVRESLTENLINWGDINQDLSEENYRKIREKILKHIFSKEVFVQDCIAGADHDNSIKVRVITEKAWHGLFTRNMLEAVNSESARKAGFTEDNFIADYTVINAPSFSADPKIDGTRSKTFVIINFKAKEILIGNTAYAGEIKKSVFSVLNFLLPQQNIMAMHCSANTDDKGNVAIFFGLSGTGKTTLSAEPGRFLIGDDEHGWSDEGVFNFESGCYAKSIGLSPDTEPEIYNASRRFGATVENVFIKEDRSLDYFDSSITENGRISYPLGFIPNALTGKNRFVKKQPKNIIMLTCDAFGVLPAVAKLTPTQAKEQFLAGYTAKVAGTEQGIKEPVAVFSPCFGAPFMALAPKVYGELLAKKIEENNVNCWLVNTGWAGGPYGVGKRMSLSLTRKIIAKIHSGELAKEKTRIHPIFGLNVPESIPFAEDSWADKDEYAKTANKLLSMFSSKN